MALKPRHKRRLFWSLTCTFCALALCVIIIPPFITLNQFKPTIEKSIYNQMSVPAKLNGDIHFSLIGGATIVVHDVVVPTARIGSVMLSIPFSDFFDIKNAELERNVSIYDAAIKIDKLEPAGFNHNINIYNSNIEIFGRKFHIIRAQFKNGEFHGTVRSKKHKYDIEFIGDTFNIRNKNNSLEITGQMYSDGSINGHISIETDKINEWFNFEIPKITNTVRLTANFEWDGGNGYKFTSIQSDNFSGNIEITPSGERIIQLVSENIDFDFSFLTQPNTLLNDTTFNLDLYGKLHFADRTFKHLRIQATSNNNKLQISNIIADDVAITGGTITANGANNIMITMPVNDTNAMCVFSGTPEKYECAVFTYGDLSGSLSVDNGTFDVFVQSNLPMPTDKETQDLIKKLGTTGTINFQFSDVGGIYKIDGNKKEISYTYAQDKTLSWLKLDLPFLPDFILNAPGNFSWQNGMLTFTPYNNQWQLSTYDNYFYLMGLSFKTWLPNLDLQSINDSSYTITGFYSNNRISNLNIKTQNHEFNGSYSGNTLTLHTKQLSLDQIKNAEFFADFANQEFLTNDPILTPFNLPINIALSADTLIYNTDSYQNFIYTLKPNTQTFSITDSNRGNILATIERNKTNYDIFAQLNKFVIQGTLLNNTLPLNVADTTITGQILLTTSGQIAHDIYYNLAGNIDLTFDGGNLIGMSFDKFYASAENITSLNAEFALANALTSGQTALKQMRIIGDYSTGNFITTQPIEISMRHINGRGGLAITDGKMTAEFDLTLRGTAPTPATIALSILPDGKRQYSLSEIMTELDPGFMRAFVKTHDKF